MEHEFALRQALDAHKNDILVFARDLISIASENPPGNHYRECVDRIRAELDRLGLAYQVVEVPGFSERPRYNLLSFHGDGQRTLYFHGHYDVVPAQSREQFTPRIENGRLYGRGAADMKTYVSVYNRTNRNSLSASVLLASNSLAVRSEISTIDYYNVGLAWKAGVGIDLEPLTLGLTITTPRINLFGSGSAYQNSADNGPSDPADTAWSSTLVATYQEDLSSRYSTPWSIGVGAAYRLGKTRIHFSGEFFAPLDLYSVLDTNPFTGQIDGESYHVVFTNEIKAIFNAGLGGRSFGRSTRSPAGWSTIRWRSGRASWPWPERPSRRPA